MKINQMKNLPMLNLDSYQMLLMKISLQTMKQNGKFYQKQTTPSLFHGKMYMV